MVVVVKDDEATEAEVTRERARLALHALHQIAVGGEDVGEVAEDLVSGAVVARREVGLADRHAECVADALSERAGRGFDAARDVALRMPGRLARPLSEPLELIEREIVARQMKQRVEQRRAVARGEDETVAIPPARVLRIVAKEASPQHVSHRRRAHRQPGMPGVRLLDHVDGEKADRVDAGLIEVRLVSR